jgi:hypothetical protein
MNGVPQKLFQKASAYGLICTASDTGNHRITPSEAEQNWELICHQEHWLLTINGFPQIRLRYEEVSQFIERFSQKQFTLNLSIRN